VCAKETKGKANRSIPATTDRQQKASRQMQQGISSNEITINPRNSQ